MVDLVKIVRILKMGIDETHLKAAGESEDSAAIARVKEADQVSWNNLEEILLHEEVNRNEKLILGDSVTQLPNRILEDIA